MTPLARWLTHRIATYGAGITVGMRLLEQAKRRAAKLDERAHRLLAELDKVRDARGELEAEMTHGLGVIESLIIAKERAECELTGELAEARRGPCEEQLTDADE